MPKFDPIYYTSWLTFSQARILNLAKRGDFIGLAGFLADFAAILEGLFALFESFAPIVTGGNFFQIALRAGAWVKDHPDPLKPTRNAIEVVMKKWNPTPGGSNG